jgi:hypothetical protein
LARYEPQLASDERWKRSEQILLPMNMHSFRCLGRELLNARQLGLDDLRSQNNSPVKESLAHCMVANLFGAMLRSFIGAGLQNRFGCVVSCIVLIVWL